MSLEITENNHTYELYRSLAMDLANEGKREEAAKVILFMMKHWPERVKNKNEQAQGEGDNSLVEQP